MKSIKIVLAVVMVQACLTPVFAQNKVLVAAHRGDWRNAPENSVLAFKNAAAMGVDIVELDLAKTSDGIIVLMHDRTVDRTTNGKGKPADYTFDDIRKLRLRNGLGRVTDHQIPTLKEVMLALKGTGVKVNLDKSYPYYHEAFAILTETGTLSQAIFKSEMPYDSLKHQYGDLIGDIDYMAVVNLDHKGAREMMVTYLENMKMYGFELVFGKDTSAVLGNNDLITRAGAKVWINSLWASLNAGHDDDLAVEQGNTKDSWDWILAHGATVIQTDRPKELLEYLRKKGLHN